MYEFSVGEVVLRLVCNIKSSEFPKGNCLVACNRLVSKYALPTALLLLKLKSKVHESKLNLP